MFKKIKNIFNSHNNKEEDFNVGIEMLDTYTNERIQEIEDYWNELGCTVFIRG